MYLIILSLLELYDHNYQINKLEMHFIIFRNYMVIFNKN